MASRVAEGQTFSSEFLEALQKNSENLHIFSKSVQKKKKSRNFPNIFGTFRKFTGNLPPLCKPSANLADTKTIPFLIFMELTCMSDSFFIIKRIILHVMAHTVKERLDVVKSLTVSLEIILSVMISKPCAFSCVNVRQLHLFICTRAKTYAICLN